MNSKKKKVVTGKPQHIPLLDRDHSILAFNERVLDWAHRPDVPLLERLRYLCIVSSNLDEFFEVRMAVQLQAHQSGVRKGLVSMQTFDALAQAAHTLVDRQYSLYNDAFMPAFAREGIEIIGHGDRTAAQAKWVNGYFEREVRPLLIPVGLDPAHPFPQVANKTLNFIVRLGGKDAFGRVNEIAIVKVPRVLPRLIRMAPKVSGGKAALVSLSSVIRSHLNSLFPGRQVGQFSQFRVTRHSDLAVDEDEARNLRTAMRLGLQQRHYGQAVRLEVATGCSDYLAGFLLRQFNLPSQSLYRVHGPVNLVRVQQLIDLVDAPHLLFAPYVPAKMHQIRHNASLFERLREGDIVLHHPYESFALVTAFLREAVHDPDVLAIKQTIYRTGPDTELLDLLCEAVRRGKEVTAIVELKARFDEENNINWAERLEAVGAQVVYGVVGLKTHAKMLLITRRESGKLVRYVHLSTGNYNVRTAGLYTDIGHMSADPALTMDIENVFLHLASHSRMPRLNKVWIAPFALQQRFIDCIAQVSAAAKRGEDARIVLKMNALTDEALTLALVRAGQRGARIDLIVRGACILPPELPGLTDNIHVRSIIGRFLEHSRVFYFRAGEQEKLYLSSADWMNRNMLRRIELAWPIDDPALRQRIIDECLVASLYDHRDAWLLSADGNYRRVQANAAGQSPGMQDALMTRYGAPTENAIEWT